ncbi:MAG: transglycosylase SLT domain-containing protein [Elusimicrobiota bacterium]
MKKIIIISVLFFIFYKLNLSAETKTPDREAIKYLANETIKEYASGHKYFKNKKMDEAYIFYKDAFNKLAYLMQNSEYNDIISARIDELMNDLQKIEISQTAKQDGVTDNPDLMVFKKSHEKLSGYSVPIYPNDPIVNNYLEQFTNKFKSVFEEALTREMYYAPLVEQAIKEYNLPIELKYLPIVESLYKPTAKSKAGAVGIWQLMPDLARHYDLKVNYWIDERMDPYKATHAALQYLKYLHELFNDWHLALAAYNRGPYGIQRDITFSKSTDYKSLQDYKALPIETSHFVPKFMAFTILADNYENYNLNPDTSTVFLFDTVNLTTTIDLEIAAKCAGTTAQKLRNLNPAIQLWCTPPNYENFELRIPFGSKEAFIANLANVNDPNPSRGVVKYKVKNGDALSLIAKKFDTKVNYIKKDNKLNNSNFIKKGQILVIRPGRNYFKNKTS